MVTLNLLGQRFKSIKDFVDLYSYTEKISTICLVCVLDIDDYASYLKMQLWPLK